MCGARKRGDNCRIQMLETVRDDTPADVEGWLLIGAETLTKKKTENSRIHENGFTYLAMRT